MCSYAAIFYFVHIMHPKSKCSVLLSHAVQGKALCRLTS